MPDIHGYEERVRRYLAPIAASGMPDEDKKALVEFSEVLRAPGPPCREGDEVPLPPFNPAQKAL